MELVFTTGAALAFMFFAMHEHTRADREEKKRKQLEAQIEYLKNK